MVRNVNFLTDDDCEDLAGAMAYITRHNKVLQLATKSEGAARPNAGQYCDDVWHRREDGR
jgi:hypothetical protein